METTKIIEKAFCYFSPVGKGIIPFPVDTIRHFEINKDELMFSKLQEITDKAEKLCEITIKFVSNGSKQQNETRDMFIKLLREKQLNNGLPIIEWLSKNTDKSSKCGLVFILIGKNGEKKFILIARYPSEEGIILQKEDKVEIIQDVFLKNSHRYKLAYFEDESLQNGLWKGIAIDKQLNDTVSSKLISDYWIKNFLRCELELTEVQGNKILGKTLRKLLNDDTTTPEDKEEINEIASAIRLNNGKSESISDFLTGKSISDQNKERIFNALPTRAVAEQVFTFNSEIFKGEYALKAMYLDNGAIVMAPTDSFDDVFSTEIVNLETKEITISTNGIVKKEAIKTK